MNAAAQEMAQVLDRDLAQLRGEVEAYPDDASLWRLHPDILNSGGTLVLHLTGNLLHFIGAVLGGSGYVRDRDAEFAERDVPRAALLVRIEDTRSTLARTLAALGERDLGAPFPAKAPASLGGQPTIRHLLLHLSVHFMYHLGQVNYHRRMLGEVRGPTPAQPDPQGQSSQV